MSASAVSVDAGTAVCALHDTKSPSSHFAIRGIQGTCGGTPGPDGDRDLPGALKHWRLRECQRGQRGCWHRCVRSARHTEPKLSLCHLVHSRHVRAQCGGGKPGCDSDRDLPVAFEHRRLRECERCERGGGDHSVHLTRLRQPHQLRIISQALAALHIGSQPEEALSCPAAQYQSAATQMAGPAL